MEELFSNLLSCESCAHGIGLHDGGGCSAARCTCTKTMQAILSEQIAICTVEFQNQYRYLH